MKGFLFSGIRTRLILLFFVALVPILLMIGYNVREERVRALDRATEQADGIFRFAVLNEQELLQETRDLLERLSAVSDLLHREDCGSYLASLLSVYPRYVNFGVIRSDGELLCSARPVEHPADLSGRGYFRKVFESRSFAIGEFQRGAVSGIPLINFGYPVFDGEAEPAAVLFAGLDLSHVTEFNAEISRRLPYGSTYVKVDGSGTVLAGIPGSPLYRIGERLKESVLDTVLRDKQGRFIAADADGVERLYLFSTLWGSLYGDEAYVLLGIPMQELLASSETTLVLNFGVLALVAAATAFLLWLAGDRLIVRPVTRIVDASERLARGDFSARVGFRREWGELGHLGHAFDEMAEEIQKKTDHLSRVRERLAHILSASPAAIYTVRLTTTRDGEPKGGFPVFLNERLRDLLGYEESDSLENPDWLAEKAHPEDLAAARDYSALLRSGSDSVEYRLRARDGSYRWVLDQRVLVRDRQGLPAEIVGSFTDITGRKRDEEEMARLGMAMTQAAEGFLITDGDGIVQYVNPAFERITGYAAADIVGRSPRILNSGRQDEAFYRGVAEAISRDGMWKGKAVNRKKDGTLYDEEATVFPVRNASGKIVNYMSALRDVTQDTLLQKQLQIAQRMEAVGTLAGGIAHDFNNALTGIFGFTEIAALKADGNEEVVSSLAEIRRCADRAAALTRQLLAYSRRKSIAPVNLDLNNVVTDLMKLVSKIVGERVRIRTVLEENLPSVFGDIGQMEQVLMNLVVNARDAMPSGGELLIETCTLVADGEFLDRHPYMGNDRYVVLSVTDTGTGIEEKIRDHVFDPFFTTKSPEKGTGLGLAMVYGIVKQHKGFIHLYSELGKGTVFRIYLPAVDAPAAAAAAPKPETIRRGTGTILLAEDDEAVRTLVKRTLEGLGYSVLETGRGEDAVAIFERERDAVSLALLDVVMPTLGGKEAYDAMKALKPGLKAIFMSGYTEASIQDAFAFSPGIPFLTKPFTPSALARKVREVLDAPG